MGSNKIFKLAAISGWKGIVLARDPPLVIARSAPRHPQGKMDRRQEAVVLLAAHAGGDDEVIPPVRPANTAAGGPVQNGDRAQAAQVPFEIRDT